MPVVGTRQGHNPLLIGPSPSVLAPLAPRLLPAFLLINTAQTPISAIRLSTPAASTTSAPSFTRPIAGRRRPSASGSSSRDDTASRDKRAVLGRRAPPWPLGSFDGLTPSTPSKTTLKGPARARVPTGLPAQPSTPPWALRRWPPARPRRRLGPRRAQWRTPAAGRPPEKRVRRGAVGAQCAAPRRSRWA